MTKPDLSYTLNQVVINEEPLECEWVITNDWNETILTFSDQECDRAYNTWWMYLTEEEQELWNEYELECMVRAECAEQDRWERVG